ncbi:MAG: M56 family peptidase, partial [Flavobacterium sp.]|nr:M56 family peptidase [Flavobacterium sp.]
MEELFQYFIKVNGLLIVFYIAYYIFLRKETFFQSNRWFLLLGIVSSFIFPLISFTNVIWIEPAPIVQNTNFYPTTTSFQVEPIIEKFNWNKLLFISYILVSIFFLTKLAIEI